MCFRLHLYPPITYVSGFLPIFCNITRCPWCKTHLVCYQKPCLNTFSNHWLWLPFSLLTFFVHRFVYYVQITTGKCCCTSSQAYNLLTHSTCKTQGKTDLALRSSSADGSYSTQHAEFLRKPLVFMLVLCKWLHSAWDKPFRDGSNQFPVKQFVFQSWEMLQSWSHYSVAFIPSYVWVALKWCFAFPEFPGSESYIYKLLGHIVAVHEV